MFVAVVKLSVANVDNNLNKHTYTEGSLLQYQLVLIVLKILIFLLF